MYYPCEQSLSEVCYVMLNPVFQLGSTKVGPSCYVAALFGERLVHMVWEPEICNTYITVNVTHGHEYRMISTTWFSKCAEEVHSPGSKIY